MPAEAKRESILIVDDEEMNRVILSTIFCEEYEVLEAEDGVQGLEALAMHPHVSAVLLDVIMPRLNGIEMLKQMSEAGLTAKLPVFLITADAADDTMREAYAMGVMDVIAKPVVPYVVHRRVNSVMELFRARRRLSAEVERQKDQLLRQTRELADMSMGMVEALAAAIEFRSDESGSHVRRIRDMTRHILLHTEMGKGLSAEEIDLVSVGAITHDVGKIAIPDAVLNKPGRLTAEEFELMKTHTLRGAELLAHIPQMRDHLAFRYAYDIALHHHERWDGRGYPHGLKGDETPPWTQVVALADVYDALVSKRCYKEPYPAAVAMEMIKGGQCGVFNPVLLRCFEQEEPALAALFRQSKKEEELLWTMQKERP